jgi:hypothetical protein
MPPFAWVRLDVRNDLSTDDLALSGAPLSAIHTHVLGKCRTKTLAIGAVSGAALENFQALSEAALKTYRCAKQSVDWTCRRSCALHLYLPTSE